eukprot:GHVQ01034555.1.p1 GENE.GHVQ01034555.1~~GHVQ01034555.1.p1  ORF type:complete len:330 (+),score=39.67 GHVQ01034555.1:354-1343(+)
MTVREAMRVIYQRLGREGRIAAGIGSGVLTVIALLQYKFCEAVTVSGNPADIRAVNKLFYLRSIFGRTRSRLTGMLMDIPVPPSMRQTVYPLFASVTGCDLNECRYPLDSYKCLGHVFARTLKHGYRHIQDVSIGSLISPVDGTVMQIGDVVGGRIEQVKGTSFNVKAFLGTDARATARKPLKYVVLYLSPDKYHHFHSPCDLAINTRRHFAGEVLPVFKSFLSRVNDVLPVNERVVYSGTWHSGALHFVAVAAYNVGNIRLAHDKEFRSNNMKAQMFFLGGDIDIEWLEQRLCTTLILYAQILYNNGYVLIHLYMYVCIFMRMYLQTW